MCEEDKADLLNCPTNGCDYCICRVCIKLAFKDSSGISSESCPMCKAPIDLHMIEVVCGKGAIRAVEKHLRSNIEFKFKEDLTRRRREKLDLKETNEKARELFNSLTEEINLKCPRCKTAFYDYDGCNALSCGSCRASFCAICLKDCGADAHSHVTQFHGNLFDKGAFEKNKRERAQLLVGKCLASLDHEPEALKMTLKNHIEKADLLLKGPPRFNSHLLVEDFITRAIGSVDKAANADRLSLLQCSSPHGIVRQGISLENISPRSHIPDDYNLSLSYLSENTYTITLERLTKNKWIHIPIVDIDNFFNENPIVESLINLKQALKCATIAIDGTKSLYQTKNTKPRKGEQLSDDHICILIYPVDLQSGKVGKESFKLPGRAKIIGLNQNLRFYHLQRYITDTFIKSSKKALPYPLKCLIGASDPKPIITEIIDHIPSSHERLNDEQRRSANPLLLKSALEVAGPPGTGKTQTIIELIKAVLACTNFNIIVMSERNGAINALAEKFASECIDTNGTKSSVTDLNLWMQILTFGSSNTVGNDTKTFFLDEKLR